MGFASFLGNAKPVQLLRGLLTQGRMPGALLFSGPEGVGKKTLALMTAQAMVCEKGPSDFCGQCLRCRKAEEMFAAAREDLARRRLHGAPAPHYEIVIDRGRGRYMISGRKCQNRNPV